MSFKISQLKQGFAPPPQNLSQPKLAPQPAVQPAAQPVKPAFDVQAAMAYNTKSEQYFKPYADSIKKVIGSSAAWSSDQFAKDVYSWQTKNGFSGNWLDGKFGPATMGKVVKSDPQLAKTYDAYAPWKGQHINEKPYGRVANLKGEVDRIRKEMGATDIPLNMLMGWIQVESGGKMNNLTTSAGFREAGLFQISEDEAKAIGADQDKIMKDQDYAIRTGIQLARHHADRLDQTLAKNPSMQQYFPKGSDMYWRLGMMGFSAGDGTVSKLVTNMANSGEAFKSWDDVMKFVSFNPSGYKHSPIKWTYHINRAFNLGNQMTGQQPAVASVKIEMRIKEARRKARKLILDGLE